MAVWLRRMRSRRSPSMRATTSSPSAIVPDSTVPRWRTRPGRPYCVSCRRARSAPVRRLDHTGVADLPTGLGVERRAVEDDVDRVCPRRPARRARRPAIERAHLRAGGLVLLAPGELGGAELVEQLAEQLDGRARRPCPSGGRVRLAGTRPLLVHQRVERVEVDGAVALLGDLAREVDREAERVVQEERVGPGDVALAEDAVEQVERRGRASGGSAPPRAAPPSARGRVASRARGTRVPSRRRSRRPARA